MYKPNFTSSQYAARMEAVDCVLQEEMAVRDALPHGEGLPREMYEWMTRIDWTGWRPEDGEEDEEYVKEALKVTTRWFFGGEPTGWADGTVPLIYKTLANAVHMDATFNKRPYPFMEGLYTPSMFLPNSKSFLFANSSIPWEEIIEHTEEEAQTVFGRGGEKAFPYTIEAYNDIQQALIGLSKLIVDVSMEKDCFERKAGYRRMSRLVSLSPSFAQKTETGSEVLCFELISEDAALEYSDWLFEPEEQRQARLKEQIID